MIIVAATSFKHDTYQFEKDKKYDVDDALGRYFILNGWAATEDGQPIAALGVEHVLEVQDGGSSNPAEGANVAG